MHALPRLLLGAALFTHAGGIAAGDPGPPASTHSVQLRGAPAAGAVTTVAQTIDARQLQGSIVRLRAMVRATSGDGEGRAALWMRVERADGTTGFFESMSERPIRTPEWRRYGIMGTLEGDARSLTFGVMTTGAVVAGFDRVELSQRIGGEWVPIAVADASFEAPGTGAWSRAGDRDAAEVERPRGAAPDGVQWLQIRSRRTPPGVRAADAGPVNESPRGSG